MFNESGLLFHMFYYKLDTIVIDYDNYIEQKSLKNKVQADTKKHTI